MKFDHLFKISRRGDSFREYVSDGILARLDFFENMLRVAVIRDEENLLNTWSVCPDGKMPLEGLSKLSDEGFIRESIKISEDEKSLSFRLSGADFTVDLRNFRITAENEKGILYQDRSGLAYNFDGELGDGSVHFTRREETQKIFGLGDKCGNVDKNGRSFELGCTDSMGFSAESSDPLYKHFPFYICENSAGSYGLFYDTASNGRINFGQEHDNYFEPFNSIRYEEKNMVFYLILGTPFEIIRRFNALCGGIAPVPRWAFSYCGSTMEYTDAPDADTRLRGFAEKCEEYGIRAGGFYLSSGYTQIGERRCVFHWNTDKIPSPKGLSDFFRDHGMEIMPNIKPAFLTDHPMYKNIAENGWFLHYKDGSPACFPFWGGMASYLDFTDPGAYAFWKECVKENLVKYGYRNIWNDNNEYDVWDKDVLACGFGKETEARLIRPVFALLMSRASREACMEYKDDQGQAAHATSASEGNGEAGLAFMISRCALPGTQRYATTWTGDNRTDFRDLRYNHRQAMTMALSGFCYFGQDIGGFSGPSPSRELFLRWLQYGVFMPRFTLHSWKPGEASTMPWLYPDLMPAVKRIFDLREKLVPYLDAQTQMCVKNNEPLVRPVFLTQPGYDPEADCFFTGDSILACPVFDEGADSVAVKLPESKGGWRLRGEGAAIKEGTELIVPCAPEDLPVWFVRS